MILLLAVAIMLFVVVISTIYFDDLSNAYDAHLLWPLSMYYQIRKNKIDQQMAKLDKSVEKLNINLTRTELCKKKIDDEMRSETIDPKLSVAEIYQLISKVRFEMAAINNETAIVQYNIKEIAGNNKNLIHYNDCSLSLHNYKKVLNEVRTQIAILERSIRDLQTRRKKLSGL